MFGTMTEKRNRPGRPRKGGGKHTSPREAFHLPVSLQHALQAFVDATEPETTKTAVIILALKRFLAEAGHWPGPDGPD